MPETPDTLGYLILGLVAAFAIPSLYLLSLYLRQRSLEQDLKLIEQLNEEQ
jgi:hypothetical protein